ncbi:hypothetical protein FO519_007231 [Halicephalobus sp. NKZ332]|nr:hypothetical protein FO519_007231 [Halicephalobus sp. NKZ332]
MDVPGTSTGVRPQGFSNPILINKQRQQGNPMLKFIRNVPYEMTVIKPDFVCGSSCCVLYLALKYHKQHQNYIETRFQDGSGYETKILLILVNIDEPTALLKDMNLYCLRAGWILILCYSEEEAAEYLENLKLSEKKKPEEVINSREQFKEKQRMIQQGRQDFKNKETQLYEAAIKVVSSIRAVTVTDAKILLGEFGSLKNLAMAEKEQLESCPGLGPIKADNVFNFFRTQMRK